MGHLAGGFAMPEIFQILQARLSLSPSPASTNSNGLPTKVQVAEPETEVAGGDTAPTPVAKRTPDVDLSESIESRLKSATHRKSIANAGTEPGLPTSPLSFERGHGGKDKDEKNGTDDEDDCGQGTDASSQAVPSPDLLLSKAAASKRRTTHKEEALWNNTPDVIDFSKVDESVLEAGSLPGRRNSDLSPFRERDSLDGSQGISSMFLSFTEEQLREMCSELSIPTHGG